MKTTRWAGIFAITSKKHKHALITDDLVRVVLILSMRTPLPSQGIFPPLRLGQSFAATSRRPLYALGDRDMLQVGSWSARCIPGLFRGNVFRYLRMILSNETILRTHGIVRQLHVQSDAQEPQIHEH